MSKVWVMNKAKRNEAKRQRRKTRAPHREAVKQMQMLAKQRVEQEERTAEMAAMLKEKEVGHEQDTD